MTSATRRRWLLGLLAALLLVGCSEEEPLTQIVVVVDSDIPDLRLVRIDVVGFTEPVHVDANLAEKRLPRKLTLVHDGGPLGPLDVTASAYVDPDGEPVRVEPRHGVEFVKDATRMLRIDLLDACVGKCLDEACVAPDRCANPAEAWSLEPWTGDVEPLGTPSPGADGGDGGEGDGGEGDGGEGDGGEGDGGPTMDRDGGAAAAPDGGDGGPGVLAQSPFDYTPSNFDPGSAQLLSAGGAAVELNCDAESVFDSSTGAFESWCGDTPEVVELTQPAGIPLVALVMDSLRIEAGDTLRLAGDRPVALVVLGDAFVAGRIDASAQGATPGPGADLLCQPDSVGLAGPTGDSGNEVGAGGGSGGGFGGGGAAGGMGADGSALVAGGQPSGNASIIPLRGGCSGGAGGSFDGASPLAAGGGGGGALQISAVGSLHVTGVISVAGGGGAASGLESDGGGGGGSGGAILLEADALDLDSAAVLVANGGGGGGGESGQSAASSAGEDGREDTDAAAGGADNGAFTSAGSGGRGGALAADPADGADGRAILSGYPGGGGGGGGGVGRIRLNGADACSPVGSFSPAPSVSCPACADACADPPAQGCAPTLHQGRTYYACSTPLPWSDAQASCRLVDLTLARPNDANENDFLAGLVDSEPAWLGGTDQVLEGNWVWTSGVAFWNGGAAGSVVGTSFTLWDAAQPDDAADDTDCLELSSDGVWAAATCANPRPYLCEQ